MTVAQNILAQLGGSRFLAMTGAKNLVTTDNSLTMKIGKNAKAVTHVVIKLDADDTYTVEALAIRGFKEPLVKGTRTYVDCSDLQAVFTALTGLETSL